MVCGPCAGLLPYDPDWIVKSPANCLHASIYFNIFNKLSENTSACKGEIYLAAYTLYEQTLINRPKVLNINRAWHIGQQIIMSNICGITCAGVIPPMSLFANSQTPTSSAPFVTPSTDSTGRQKWKQLKYNQGRRDEKERKSFNCRSNFDRKLV